MNFFVLTLISLIMAIMIFYFSGEFLYRICVRTYLKLAGKKKYPSVELDENGVPKVNYGGEVGIQYNPMIVAQEAVLRYKKFQKGDKNSIQNFVNCIQSLEGNSLTENRMLFWEYHYPYNHYNMMVPWRSGMAQGDILTAFIFAYEYTNDEKYLDKCSLIINSFYLSVEDGGVTYFIDEDSWWYEEYAHPEGKKSMVLNGMLVTVLAIWEYYQLTDSKKAKELFSKGYQAVINYLPNYDRENGSYYDILGQHASVWYHNFHVELLQKLDAVKASGTLKTYLQKWNVVQKQSFYEIWFSKHSKKKIKITLLVFISITLLSTTLTYTIYHILN